MVKMWYNIVSCISWFCQFSKRTFHTLSHQHGGSDASNHQFVSDCVVRSCRWHYWVHRESARQELRRVVHCEPARRTEAGQCVVEERRPLVPDSPHEGGDAGDPHARRGLIVRRLERRGDLRRVTLRLTDETGVTMRSGRYQRTKSAGVRFAEPPTPYKKINTD